MAEQTGDGHILVTDDDKVIRKICQNALEPVGYQVSMAENGQQALDMVNKAHYDLILTDMEMPVMDGMTLLMKLQELSQSPPVIMFTVNAFVPHAVMAISRGAYDFITKPFMKDALLASVKRCLETTRLQKELKDLRVVQNLLPFFESVLSTQDLGKVMQTVLSRACILLKANGGSIMLYEEADKTLIVKAAGGSFSENVLGRKMSPGDRVVGEALKKRSVITIHGTLKKDKRFAHMESHQEIISSMAAPMLIDNRPVGVVCIKRVGAGDPFQKADEEIFTLLANYSALAISNAMAHEKIKRDEEDLEAQLDQRTKALEIANAEIVRLKSNIK